MYSRHNSFPTKTKKILLGRSWNNGAQFVQTCIHFPKGTKAKVLWFYITDGFVLCSDGQALMKHHDDSSPEDLLGMSSQLTEDDDTAITAS